eukprot:TRINITY_DN81957_c0_g1_i1.p1 TRINITY_DN81957_c0_g1~~TRINITY_DN81957_c0_g1_i1.p1  ORF type:complete len:106 (-),score=2.20 TRINITY_DN81957_c0_g1_i1:70-387(-)
MLCYCFYFRRYTFIIPETGLEYHYKPMFTADHILLQPWAVEDDYLIRGALLNEPRCINGKSSESYLYDYLSSFMSKYSDLPHFGVGILKASHDPLLKAMPHTDKS